MIYVTFRQSERTNEPFRAPISFADILNNPNIEMPCPTITPRIKAYFRTHTFVTEANDESFHRLCRKYDLSGYTALINALWGRHVHLLKDDMSTQYHTFYIPKHSGGMRRIDAPEPELMYALTDIKDTLQNKLYVLPHNAAHAYTQQRSTVTAMQLHQSNESKWFLKLDIKDFFPSHNHAYIMDTLEKLFPFSVLMARPDTKQQISDLIKLGLLNNALPQGTPLSPLLTNVLMAPIDFKIEALLRSFDKQNFIYTRYADDLTISGRYNFNWQELQNQINTIIKDNSPFELKTVKTRYGSSAGRNWNLGIMLNKDNNITIGHKQNQRFRAAVFSFLSDLTNGRHWDKIDVQVLNGQISYYSAIQPEYVEQVIRRYSEKFNIDFKQAVRHALS